MTLDELFELLSSDDGIEVEHYEEEVAVSALFVNEEGQLIYRPPEDFPFDQSDPIYFLAACFYRHERDPEFREEMEAWVRNNTHTRTTH